MERRGFVKKISRVVVLSGLLGLSGAMLLREGDDDTEACDYDFICKNCKKKSTCKLPEAEINRSDKNK